MSDYQVAREVHEALRVQQMTPAARFAWLQENWGRLQDSASVFYADTQRPPPAARSFARLEEKNRFDDERELTEALQIHLAHQK